MVINIICVGKLSPDYRALFNLYVTRIKLAATLNIIELKELNHVNALTQVKLETAQILAVAAEHANIYLCASSGLSLDSATFARLLAVSEITFIIGGSHGVDEGAFKNKLSFSALTFPHQLFRIILAEQIFRGLSIRRGTKYHK